MKQTSLCVKDTMLQLSVLEISGMQINKICCNITCPLRFSCLFFSKAIDYIQGKVRGGYEEIKECNGDKYLKG